MNSYTPVSFPKKIPNKFSNTEATLFTKKKKEEKGESNCQDNEFFLTTNILKFHVRNKSL